MDSERIVSPVESFEDAQEASLRPLTLDDFLGQEHLRKKLGIFIEAANQRSEAMDHVLLSGPPGLGKTTFSRIIANHLRAHCHVTSGPAIERQGDLAAILTNLQPRDVLFIDEIHRLKTVVEEVLYSAMEDYKLDIIVGKGPDARTLRLDLPRFTLIGATTKSGLLSSPLRDRFGILGQFEFYDEALLARIVCRSSGILGIGIDEAGALAIARRSRGTPRIANRLLRRVRDVAQIQKVSVITESVAATALELLNVDKMGLDQLDLKILNVLCRVHEGQPIGLNTLAISVGEEEETIAEVCEPYLIQIGFMERTPRGRKVTLKGQTYFEKREGK
ncbi:MAG: Holliday junction branch migration DNA helicase RuvB [Candidatus Cloacimonetes bacterium]|nr:Holliday junction branch migration DNA helicase RuvB [Candidatus Cloacimonadota bacterium]